MKMGSRVTSQSRSPPPSLALGSWQMIEIEAGLCHALLHVGQAPRVFRLGGPARRVQSRFPSCPHPKAVRIASRKHTLIVHNLRITKPHNQAQWRFFQIRTVRLAICP
ncbi:hypothetical protein, partial [Mesorhizobium sp. B1-1-5]|uniref:hypothetical protein n=1 Tax=Mesorhizobium sp. B1-1-5 TaxID=2589979 RepID=UPI001AED5A08